MGLAAAVPARARVDIEDRAERTELRRCLAHVCRSARAHLRGVGLVPSGEVLEMDWVVDTPTLPELEVRGLGAAGGMLPPMGLLCTRFDLAPPAQFLVEMLLAARIDPWVSAALDCDAHAGAVAGDGWVEWNVMQVAGLCRGPADVRALLLGAQALEGFRLVNAVAAGEGAGVARLRLSDRATAFCAGGMRLDGALGGCGVLLPADGLGGVEAPCTVEQRDSEALVRMLAGATRMGRTVAVGLLGPAGSGKSHLARYCAQEAGAAVLVVDPSAGGAAGGAWAEVLHDALMWCRLYRAWLVVDRVDWVERLGDEAMGALQRAIQAAKVPVLLLSRAERFDGSFDGLLQCEVAMGVPSVEKGAGVWRELVARRGEELEPLAAAELAAEALLLPGAVEKVVEETMLAASGASCDLPLAERLAQVLEHRQGGRPFGRLAKPVRIAGASLSRLVLPPKQAEQLGLLADAIRHRGLVLEQWGFGAHMAAAGALVAMLAGPPGTGKTFAAAALAADLGRRLLAVNVAELTSKWVGETEKNLTELFRLASSTTGILLIDEADALFSRRVDVEKAADKHANAVTNVLLHELERFTGVAILTTNNQMCIDEAFRRRLAVVITFERPSLAERLELWKRSVPAQCPMEADVDWAVLAERFELSGGEIKNALMTAAYAAARRGGGIGMGHLQDAIEAEYAKSGRLFPGA